jgi:hypothetical protein
MLPQVEFESTYSDNRNHDGESTTNHHPDTKPSGFGAKQPAITTEAEVTENQPAVQSFLLRRSTRACKMPNYLNGYVLKNVCLLAQGS